MTARPLRVTAHMSEAVVYYGDGMHLDGILSYGAYLALSGQERRDMPPISAPWALDLDLPLETWEVEETAPPEPLIIDPRMYSRPGVLWGWRASAVHAAWTPVERHAVRKRPEAQEMARWTPNPSVNIAGGQLKACNIEYPSLFSHELTWYALGDARRVRALLERVHGVGKLANHGKGRVMRWSVEELEVDCSIEHDGVLRRTMPQGYRGQGGGWETVAAIRAPYHHASRLVAAVVPIFEALTPIEGLVGVAR